MSLFDAAPFTLELAEPTNPGEVLSYGRRLTLRRQADLAAGRHPVTGLPLLHSEWGFTCGTCAHHRAWRMGGTYHKCALHDTGSEATDIRVGWPACTRYRIEAQS
jgi:hypothetical protein